MATSSGNYTRFFSNQFDPSSYGSRHLNFSQYWPLHRAILEGDWESVKRFYMSHPRAETDSITESKDTAVMVGVMSGQKIEFIKNQVEFGRVDLRRVNKEGNTALHEAAIVGNLKAAEFLVGKDTSLLYIRNSDGYLPLHLAASHGQKEILCYFLRVGEMHNLQLSESELDMLMHLEITAGFFDLATYLLASNPRLAFSRWQGVPHLEILAQIPCAFPSRTKLNIWKRFICNFVPVQKDPFDFGSLPNATEDTENPVQSSQAPTISSWIQSSKDYFSVCCKLQATDTQKMVQRIVPHVKHIQEIKSMHDRTKLFVRMFCWELQDNPIHSSILEKAFLLGAKNGIQEIVEQILEVFPDAISCVDEEDHYALHLAVMYRREHVFNFIIQQMGVRKRLLLKVDKGGNNILHLVGRMPYQPQLEVVSGAFLQMQREVQWYKEVEKLVPVQATTVMNHDGKTPMMVFEENHRRMIQSEEQWIVSLASACIVSTTIIGTIAFSAAIQVPGGNNGNDGHPNLDGDPCFKLFAISNAVALYSAISTFLIFLSIFTTRYTAIDFLYSLPDRLIIGLISLFVSITSIIIAFSSALYLMSILEKQSRILAPVAIMSFGLVTLFAFLQFPLLLNMMKTTYGQSMFNLSDGRNRPKRHKILSFLTCTLYQN
ncbi:Serine/threonine-protein phosphatase 6 regulatory ankyrin repeat subunit C [Camellia lanceoleosa]|uniref:Serine/threonine-protein phosphatase 6 regulatory ankyrin repeat subunit C n=1 Tax=Camellia lanceoleosa TaxID=1840588 RepID=A0ACC0G6T4_9ERIC|nr:Serine/threonine-protein phosphatase 6 regulatory ankyrin repeat subunit C [Camellia lanceoleosa]